MSILKDRVPSNNTILPSLEDPFAIPKSTNDLKEWHYKALRRLNKRPVKEPFSGIMTLEVNIPEFIDAAKQMKLISIASYNDSLRYLKNDTLKQILKHQEFKISGNKDKLVQRILSNIKETTVRNLEEYSDFYVLTDEGQKVVNESYDKIEEERNRFFKQVIDHIMQKQFDTAYRMVCKRNAEQPVPPGINCNWSAWYKRGITDIWLLNSIDLMKRTEAPLISASAIYSLYSGDSNRNVVHMLNEVFSPDIQVNEVDIDVRYESSKLTTNIDISNYKEQGMQTYQFLATLDERTCPICGNLDGKLFSIGERQVGVNCPPMHRGCRCTTISAIGLEYGITTTRAALDSKKMRIKVPSTMNWSEWKKQYIDKDNMTH